MVLFLVSLMANLSAAGEMTNFCGVVTFGRSGYNWAFLLQDNGESARLEFAPGHFARTGERVEAAGNVIYREPMFRMNDVTVNRLGKGPLPPREKVRIDELYKPGNDHFGRPVEVIVQVHDVTRRRTQLQLYVFDEKVPHEGATASIPMRVNDEYDPNIKRGAILRIKAVPSMIYENFVRESDVSRIKRSLTLNVLEMHDVEVLTRSPWWTPERIWLVAGFTFLALLAALGWGAAMTAKVKRERIAAEAIRVERKRMAMDLHDTIEQHLASVKIMLAGALDPECNAAAARKMIERAEDMLIFAKNEVRQAVMDLHGDGAARPLAEALNEIASGVTRSGAARVRFRLRGLPEHMAPKRVQAIVMIAREAVTNAVKHGRAKNIAIVADPVPDGFALRILNDGEPFDRANALGPSTGHYGLAGMEERARRGKFKLSFGVDGKWMSVRIEVSNCQQLTTND